MSTPPKSVASPASPELLPAQLAKAALRRLLEAKLEPTPENYARAYQQEVGGAAPAAARPPDTTERSGEAWAELIGRIVQGVERRSRQWTPARKKDSLQRVLGGSRGDATRLQQRLRQLVASWDSESADAGEGGSGETMPAPLAGETMPAPLDEAVETSIAPLHLDLPVAAVPVHDWNRIVATLDTTVQHALPGEADGRALAAAIADATQRIQEQGATPLLADELKLLCQRAERVIEHRHHLQQQLGGLCRELTASLTDLAEDDSWAKGQCEAMQLKIDEGLTARGVKSVSELLTSTRERQTQLRIERERARDALKSLINRMLSELDELGSQTGRFHESVGRYADVIEKA
ncbi:MAG TPA: GGDEF domain-containing protein, partial [Albitalea sp.]|nr:GGDEF domain-containing protein [Albitalea sp.]